MEIGRSQEYGSQIPFSHAFCILSGLTFQPDNMFIVERHSGETGEQGRPCIAQQPHKNVKHGRINDVIVELVLRGGKPH